MTMMFFILLGLFLTFTAFALDLGNLYLWRLRLDKAARAGSLAGLGFRGIQGWDYVQPGTAGNVELIAATRQSVQDNMSAYGVTLNTGNIVVNYDSDADSISVQVNHSPSTFLVGKLNNIFNFGFNSNGGTPLSPTWNLSRTHHANLNRANVVLMIDVSGSMLCPAVGPCDCRTTGDCKDKGESKLDKLADGVERFANHFNPNRDRISVIAFNLAARQLYSFGGGELLEDATSNHELLTTTSAHEFLTNADGNLRTVLTDLAGSNTNHCDALAEGIRELEELSVHLGNGSPARDRRLLQPFVVFFTDGAPNAMRGIFSGGDIPDGSCYPYGSTGTSQCVTADGTRDFYHYALEWTNIDGTQQYRGPGPFVLRELDAGGVSKLFNFQFPGNQAAPPGNQVCGKEVNEGNPLRFEQTITKNTSGGPGGRGHSQDGCLDASVSNFSFAIPYTNPDNAGGFTGANYGARVSNVPISTADTTWRDPSWPLKFEGPTPYGLQKYDELPYYCAIEAADYIRRRFAGTIFTVGLGPAEVHRSGGGQDNTCNDPLQDPDDHTSRKDFFLTRLAFARSMFTNQLSPQFIRSHYQISGSQTPRTVSGCDSHRLKSPSPAPQPNVGYTSALQVDDNQTYKNLRPLRPASMDTLLAAGGTGTRRMETQGEYFPTDDATEIPRIFDSIAKTILLRSSS